MEDFFVSRGQRGGRKPWLAGICSALALVMVAAPAKAGSFTAGYDLSNWTLINTNADGTAVSPDSGVTLVLTGGNNGSSQPGVTDFIINAPSAGLVQFSWSYMSLDSTVPACGDSGTLICDDGGYLVGGVYTELADDTTWMTTGSGTASFSVTNGESFGFRVNTADNTGEPGILSITDFSAPVNSTAPEPGTWSVAFGLGAAMILGWRRKRRGANSIS